MCNTQLIIIVCSWDYQKQQKCGVYNLESFDSCIKQFIIVLANTKSFHYESSGILVTVGGCAECTGSGQVELLLHRHSRAGTSVSGGKGELNI